MGAPEEYFRELAVDLIAAKSDRDRDAILDEWYDAEHRATDYDADIWGFDSRRWMTDLRVEMERRIAAERAAQRSSK